MQTVNRNAAPPADPQPLLGAAFRFAAASLAVLAIAGCGANLSTTAAPAVLPTVNIQGSVHGGQQPVNGAAIHLYAANATAYAGITTDLITVPTTSNPDGSFSITGKYTPCTAGQQMYITANGGNPGAQINPQIGLMAALGDCANLLPTTFIQINEVTTAAAVFALAPFMSGATQLGAPASNSLGLAGAFKNAAKLVNTATGVSPGPSLAANAVAPQAALYTIADILATCINSTGGTASTTTCGKMFALATPVGGTLPSDTIGLALSMAQNPTLNVSALFGYTSSTPPFPSLGAAPSDWTLAISYTTGFNSPQSTSIDANGNVYVANAGSNIVTVLAQNGSTLRTLTGNGLAAPAAVAIDSSGDAFVANKGASTVSAFTGSGGVLGASPFTAGTAPSSLAFDAFGNVFIANSTGNSVTELNSSGALVRTATSNINTPTAIVIDPK